MPPHERATNSDAPDKAKGFDCMWRVIKTVDDVSCAQKAVLVCLAAYADSGGFGAYPAVATIAHRTCLDARSVRRVLKQLERLGHIQQTGIRPPPGGGHPVKEWTVLVPKRSDSTPDRNRTLSPIDRTVGPFERTSGPIDRTQRPFDRTQRPMIYQGSTNELPMTCQGGGAPPAESVWSDGFPAPDQPPAWLTPDGEAATADQQPIPKPSPETDAVKSSDTPSTTGGDWPETVVLLTAALLYAPEQVARIDSRRPPSAEAVRGWLAGRMPVGAAPLCGHEDRARRTARDFDADREALLDAYRLKADRGGLKVNRGGPGGLLRWWFDKGFAEAVGNARHASALRRRKPAGSTNCNAAWENRPPAKPMKFDPNWEVRP